eukprot:gene11926-13161_t
MEFDTYSPVSNPQLYTKDYSCTPPATLGLMAQYREMFQSIDKLFARIKNLTLIDHSNKEYDNTTKLKKISYRIYAFRQIDNSRSISYLNYAGKLTKDVLNAWDKFFFGIATMTRKRCKRLRLFYELASERTQNCRRLLDEVKNQLVFRLGSCVLRSNKEYSKRKTKKAKRIFKLSSLRFEMKFLKKRSSDEREGVALDESKDIAMRKGRIKGLSNPTHYQSSCNVGPPRLYHSRSNAIGCLMERRGVQGTQSYQCRKRKRLGLMNREERKAYLEDVRQTVKEQMERVENQASDESEFEFYRGMSYQAVQETRTLLYERRKLCSEEDLALIGEGKRMQETPLGTPRNLSDCSIGRDESTDESESEYYHKLPMFADVDEMRGEARNVIPNRFTTTSESSDEFESGCERKRKRRVAVWKRRKI